MMKLLKRCNIVVHCRRCVSTSKHEWESSALPTFQYTNSKSASKQKYAYGWGLAASGALGVQDVVVPKNPTLPQARIMSRPYMLPFSKYFDIKRIAAGYGFSLFSTGSKLFGCGLNTCGQIGFHPTRQTQGRTREWLITPQKIYLPEEKCKAIYSIACGRSHSLICTNDGLYSLGHNGHGQCGRGVIENEDYCAASNLHKVEDITGKIKKIVCGLDHSLVLMKDSTLWSFGLGSDGQLGSGNYMSNHVPCKVSDMGDLKGETVVDVACAGDTVLVVTSSGHIFGWGMTEYSQLQIAAGQSPQLNVPRHLNFNLNEKIVQAVASGSACALLTESGLVYSWGYGILGQGPETELRPLPSLLPPPLFGATEFEPHIRVKNIYSGLMHFAATNSNGDIYTWGKNRYGILGLGNEKDQYFPLKVCLVGSVSHVTCSPDHMLVLSTPSM